MKLYDISQEVFSCCVYEGDPKPYRHTVRGEIYNLTDFSMCAHNGTHVDAPFHFISEGKTVEQIALEKFVGQCAVICFEGRMSGENALRVLEKACSYGGECHRRILLSGDAIVTAEAARVFASEGIYLLGVESQSIGEIGKPMEVHRILLGKEVVLLEGLRLGGVAEGGYFLSAAPLALGGSDGAPCRALIIDFEG